MNSSEYVRVRSSIDLTGTTSRMTTVHDDLKLSVNNVQDDMLGTQALTVRYAPDGTLSTRISLMSLLYDQTLARRWVKACTYVVEDDICWISALNYFNICRPDGWSGH